LTIAHFSMVLDPLPAVSCSESVAGVFAAIDACLASRSEKSYLRKQVVKNLGGSLGNKGSSHSEAALGYHERLRSEASKALGSASKIGPGTLQAALVARGRAALAKSVRKRTEHVGHLHTQ